MAQIITKQGGRCLSGVVAGVGIVSGGAARFGGLHTAVLAMATNGDRIGVDDQASSDSRFGRQLVNPCGTVKALVVGFSLFGTPEEKRTTRRGSRDPVVQELYNSMKQGRTPFTVGLSIDSRVGPAMITIGLKPMSY